MILAIFGFIVLVIIGLWLTGATLFALFFGGLDLGPAKLPIWIICVPLLVIAWWQIAQLAPFAIVTGGLT